MMTAKSSSCLRQGPEKVVEKGVLSGWIEMLWRLLKAVGEGDEVKDTGEIDDALVAAVDEGPDRVDDDGDDEAE